MFPSGRYRRRRPGPQADEKPNQVARRNPHRSRFSRSLGNRELRSNRRLVPTELPLYRRSGGRPSGISPLRFVPSSLRSTKAHVRPELLGGGRLCWQARFGLLESHTNEVTVYLRGIGASAWKPQSQDGSPPEGRPRLAHESGHQTQRSRSSGLRGRARVEAEVGGSGPVDELEDHPPAVTRSRPSSRILRQTSRVFPAPAPAGRKRPAVPR